MKQLSKPFYISSYLAGSILPGVLVLFGGYMGLDEEFLVVLAVVPFVLLLFVILSLTYVMWSSIEDVYTRMSPAKAVILLFIPIYNIYWMYQVLVGFAEDYNNFVSRNELETPVLEDGIFKSYFLFTLFSFIPYIGWIAGLINLAVGSMMIAEICDAVNAVNSALSLSGYSKKNLPIVKKETKIPWAWISLIFVVIVIIIVARIAIVVPNYLKSASKSRQFEAHIILTGIYEAELAYFDTEATFSTEPDKIGFEPASRPKYYQFKIIHADEEGFTARAWGNIDKDDRIDIWEVTDKDRWPVSIYDDVTNSGEEVEIPKVEEAKPLEVEEDEPPESEGFDFLQAEGFDPLDKQSEAQVILREIYETERKYFFKESNYSIDFTEMGFKLASKPKYYQFNIIYADKDGFLVRAWGNIDEDDKIDIWEISKKTKWPVCIYNDVKNEGEEIEIPKVGEITIFEVEDEQPPKVEEIKPTKVEEIKPTEVEEIKPTKVKKIKPVKVEKFDYSKAEGFDPLDKQSEARTILLAIYDAELRYFLNRRKFGADLNEIGFKLVSKPKYYQFEIIHADEDSFEVRAWGNIDKDDAIDIWMSTDNARAPYCIYNDLKNEGREIYPLKLR